MPRKIYNAEAVRAAMRESPLEAKFAARWASRYPDLPFEREVKIIPKRQFRADFAFNGRGERCCVEVF